MESPWVETRSISDDWCQRGSPRVVLGIDGGATSTECVVLQLEQETSAVDPQSATRLVAGRGKGGSSNKNSVGDEEARKALQSAIAAALSHARVPRTAVVAVAACMAGVDRPNDVAVLTSWLRSWFPESTSLSVHNDAVAALASGTLGWVPGLTPNAREPWESRAPAGAVVVIAGTGSIVYGFRGDGQTARASGAGPLLGDRGSGYAIASEALAAVMRASDGRGEPTSLTEAILGNLSLKEPSDLIGWAYSDLAWARVAALLPQVKRCAADGDPVALRILREAATELGCGISAVARRLDLVSPTGASDGVSQVMVVAAGGVLQDKSTFDLHVLLRSRLAETLPSATLQEPQVPWQHFACTHTFMTPPLHELLPPAQAVSPEGDRNIWYQVDAALGAALFALRRVEHLQASR